VRGVSIFSKEADLVQDWLALLKEQDRKQDWTVYPETAGWDVLLVHRNGSQIGIEAKLSLNAKVLAQALDGSTSYWNPNGPDYRAVLVPEGKVQHHMGSLARALGVTVLRHSPKDGGHGYRYIDLPTGEAWSSREWPNWCPAERCKLPDYVPDVEAGHSAPVQLTDWKVRAIKLLIVLERRGYVTRADMKALQISPTRWCDSWHGFLARDPRGFIRCERTPDLKAQHPVNWAQIDADFQAWGKEFDLKPTTDLFGGAAA
jgi:hypothetical protein